METVLIDQFVVPEAAVEEFLRQTRFSANIVKTRRRGLRYRIVERRLSSLGN